MVGGFCEKVERENRNVRFGVTCLSYLSAEEMLDVFIPSAAMPDYGVCGDVFVHEFKTPRP